MHTTIKDSVTLGIYNNQEKVNYGLSEALFGSAPVFAGENDIVDIKSMIENEPDMADFNSECLKATIVATGEQTDAMFIKLPLISQKEVIQPCDLKDSSYFDSNGNEIETMSGKYRAKKAKVMAAGRTRVYKRREFMAGELLKTGKMTINGENIDETEIDFGINHTVTFAPADYWTQAASWPAEQLDAMCDVINVGAADINDVHVIHTPSTWAALRRHESVAEWRQNLIDARRYEETIFPKTKPRGLSFKFEDADGRKHWVYTEPTGELVDGRVYVINMTKFAGKQVWGRIVTDIDGSSVAQNIYYSEMKKFDPIGEEVKYQSKPLFVANLDAVISAQVV